MLIVVAGNPDAPRSSATERVVRRLQFADADLQRKIAEGHGTARAAELVGLRHKLAAAVNILRGMVAP